MTKHEGNAWRWLSMKDFLPGHFSHGIGFINDTLCQITFKPVTREHLILLRSQTEGYEEDYIWGLLAFDFLYGAIP